MEEEIELSLELSLNGRFGVNTKSASNNNLIRSSSISNLLEIPQIPSENLPLTRTCSLPVESEEETRRRKEIQMLRRMEAKRKRSEKQRREIGADGNGKFEISGNGVPKVGFSGHGFDSKPGFGFGFGNGGDNNGILYPPFSRGSSASSSSGTSELESQTPPTTNQGMNKNTEAKSPQSVQSFTDQIEKRPIQSPGDPKRLKKTTSVDTTTMVNTNLNPSSSVSETSNIVTNVLTDMPCVSTKEEGPNGKRIEGFLYRYRKGEEVRIVCVCHGSFLTPAEFIKHAGGGDVEHPLRHIVVKPSPFL